MKFVTLTSLSFVLPAVLTAGSVIAAEEHRELGAHEHGHGTLNIAIENTRVSMELEVPGMDITGFEHAAKSKEQKAAVKKASGTLSDPLSLFKMPAAASCKVADTKVKHETNHEDGKEDHGKEHATGVKDKDGKTAKHDGHDHGADEGHSEFHAAYTLDCANPGNLTSIEFAYFKSFKGAQNLTVNVVTGKAQNKYEVSRDKPVLDLGGMM